METHRTVGVYEKSSEAYKIGFVHGLYDAVSDDGAYYGSSGQNRFLTDDAPMYAEGYWDGRAARLGAIAARAVSEPGTLQCRG